MRHKQPAFTILRVCVILFLLTTAILPGGNVQALSNSPALSPAGAPNAKAKLLLEKMTPAERVGQLFLITLKGRKIDLESQIYDLIANQHVGGVMLRADNDNFTGPENTILEAYTLVKDLQTAERASSEINVRQYIPLFIGISQEGDGYPYDQILSGLTPLPNLMTIGATWKPQLSEQVGTVLGKELSTLGFNLVLGPSLDVLNVVYSETGEDLGTRTFGGDPYWVGKMGASYINGIHVGSNNRIAVIAKHFPGRGGSDRPPEEEISTVRKSLDELKKIELAPFFDVTGNAPDPGSTTDGLLVSHIRYQGFQGNIRATTKPVSFDQTALELIMKLDPFSAWQKNGGVIVSDDLSSPAVSRFYDPTGTAFDARQVARNAFMAGNDLLYVGDFIATGDADSYATILRTLDLFTQRYQDDPTFAQRVDQSVEKLLTLKYKLYPNFDISEVVPTQESLSTLNLSQKITFEVSKSAVTLISPDAIDLSTILPNPPDSRERMIFLTDTQSTRQCPQCIDQNVLSVDAFQSEVLKLFGPKGSGQVNSAKMSSYSFTDLITYLDGKTETATLDSDINLANWIVVSFLNVQSDRSASSAFKRFLSEKPSILRDKKIIVFAFNAPYYLDATNITKLTAYYALYNKSPDSINVAARVLFGELIPGGALPVSVPGIGYVLLDAMSPDPEQEIQLYADYPTTGSQTPQPSKTPQSTPTLTSTPATPDATKEPPTYKAGDTIPLYTSIIYDHNHNPVPNDTPVRFIFTTTTGEGSPSDTIESKTLDGIARASYRIQIQGLLEIKVETETTKKSTVLQLNITKEAQAAITLVPTEPSKTPTPTITPSTTPSLTPTSTATSTDIPPTATPTLIPPPTPQIVDWSLSTGLVGLVCSGFILIRQRKETIRWRVRFGLLTLISGLIGYSYLALGLPGSSLWLENLGRFGILLLTIISMLLGWLVGWVWKQIENL